ncbi:pyridoxal phosphate-dependent transferase [Suillus subalutaceus]|uniref:pyridoxal phosphate-dependent transferase n=1 Tax=Suillus subalutaceus TaxID=48586 RepID=UPI001B88359D|nr:pyridoxal phosphate-dependent transferase [Suillus subalutaceus]KAG1839121.1 pyridoxal phosphate-dependent transferase [Suillus subalutaceus]
MLRLLTRPLYLSVTPSSSLRFKQGLALSSRKMATFSTPDFNKVLYAPLAEIDPQIQNIIDKETWRQFSGLELIASENLTSRATLEANGSILTNKYSEGLPNARYYGGNEYIDELEILCRKRALEAFNLDPAKWGVNVQPYSGSVTLTALIQPQDRLMGLGLPDGGHLTHGYYVTTQLIDYAGLERQAKDFQAQTNHLRCLCLSPRLGLCCFEKTADAEGAYLMADIAHTSGLVAAQTLNNPFEYCDIVTTTTHKTLRGPRAGLIFFKRDGPNSQDLEKRVNDAVFPACQGGPHNNTIAAVATALLQVSQPTFKAYARQVISNAQTLAAALQEHGYKLQTGGTDNHLVLWDLRPLGLTGSKVEKVCDLLGITINKNAVSGDASAQTPGGIRLGTSALTSRDMTEEDIKVVASFLHRAVQLSLFLQKEAGSKLLKDFIRAATAKGSAGAVQVDDLRRDVVGFARRWPLPGVDVSTLKRPAGIEEDF